LFQKKVKDYGEKQGKDSGKLHHKVNDKASSFDSNKFQILQNNEERENDTTNSPLFVGTNTISYHQGKRKSIDRKKRSRKELITPPKNQPTTQMQNHPITVGPNSSKFLRQFMLIHDKNTSSSKVVQLKTYDNFKNGSKNIYDLPFGTKSTMPARVVSPNHIQFSEGTEPPNFLKNQM